MNPHSTNKSARGFIMEHLTQKLGLDAQNYLPVNV